MERLLVASCLGIGLALAGCTSDDNAAAPTEDGGVTHEPGGNPDATVGTHDGSTGGDDAGSDATSQGDTSTGGDSSSGDDSSSSGDTSTSDAPSDAPQGDAGDLCAQIPDGTYKATAVACNGTPVDITGVLWIANYANGASSSFAETINSCTLTQSGTASCTANVLQHTNTATSCNPTNCSPFGATTCSQVTGTAYWQVTSVSGTVFVLQSMNEPDGGPSPIKTCTDQGKQNPVQVTWTKQ